MRRFDVVTIFPDYFSVLDLSLVGKARERSLLDVGVHDLRRWAEGPHRSVDDTPYGGGAGMVMRADVWGRALDDIIGEDPHVILAVPTPSGRRLTQRDVEQLASRRERIVIACGRYEGIDRRVLDHYGARPGVSVCEFSLGDYVLNGGEVAALALIEAVGRLEAGVVGNPDSLIEESHSEEGFLEYPVYTKPPSWRDLDVPAILRTGDHERIARWRRDRAIATTARRRPDLVSTCALRTSDDYDALARAGVLLRNDSVETVSLQQASVAQAGALAELAGRLFPLACPATVPRQACEAYIATHLDETHVRDALASDNNVIFVAQGGSGLLGYAWVSAPPAPVPVRKASVDRDRLAYLEKLYVAEDYQGSGLASALVEAALRRALGVWPHMRWVGLGTHYTNARAIAFYRRQGWTKAGRRRFDVGGIACEDVVLVRDLTVHPPRPDLSDVPAAWNNGPSAEEPRDLPQGERKGDLGEYSAAGPGPADR